MEAYNLAVARWPHRAVEAGNSARLARHYSHLFGGRNDLPQGDSHSGVVGDRAGARVVGGASGGQRGDAEDSQC